MPRERGKTKKMCRDDSGLAYSQSRLHLLIVSTLDECNVAELPFVQGDESTAPTGLTMHLSISSSRGFFCRFSSSKPSSWYKSKYHHGPNPNHPHSSFHFLYCFFILSSTLSHVLCDNCASSPHLGPSGCF